MTQTVPCLLLWKYPRSVARNLFPLLCTQRIALTSMTPAHPAPREQCWLRRPTLQFGLKFGLWNAWPKVKEPSASALLTGARGSVGLWLATLRAWSKVIRALLEVPRNMSWGTWSLVTKATTSSTLQERMSLDIGGKERISMEPPLLSRTHWAQHAPHGLSCVSGL